MRRFLSEMRQIEELQARRHERMQRMFERDGLWGEPPDDSLWGPPDSRRRQMKERLDKLRKERAPEAGKSRSWPFDEDTWRWPRFPKDSESAGGARLSEGKVTDAGDHLVFRIRVPGFDRKQVKVQFSDDSVTVEARRVESQKRKDRSEEGESWTESATTRVLRRTVPLPARIVPSKAKVSYQGDTVEAILPKAPEGEGGREGGSHRL
ncbi:MAG: Hsp20/alpha crystallin family protein [Candidatus Riflebacteria bacterium]|nr:Hsp20/alpha crystallin family protein [Candidatus Riflebacteria bacterium]